ncbi:hypothetical protein HYV88_02465 [Candidatus Woesearchaeota archaeon]|nr:hypothetical protein [Candidatus Woesearchaeota archaeon]
MEGIKLRRIEQVNPGDGARRFFQPFQGERGYVTLGVYKKGSGSDFHYHMGDDPSKNPERLFLVTGRCFLEARDGFSSETYSEVLDGKIEVSINLGILHKITALDDVVFFEFRNTPFNRDNPDKYPENTYAAYVEIMKMKR